MLSEEISCWNLLENWSKKANVFDVSCFDNFSSLEVQYRDLTFLFVASITPFWSKIFPLSAEEVAIVIEMKLILNKISKIKPTIERTAKNLHFLFFYVT